MEIYMKKHLLFLLAGMMIFTGTASAEFYTWEDEAGVPHITDYPPPANQKSQNVKVHDKGGPLAKPEQATSDEEKKPVITLYTKNDCPDCVKAKEYLNSKKLAFTEYNIDVDKAAAAKRKEIDDSSDVPFAIINRIQVYGFSETVYNRALKSAP